MLSPDYLLLASYCWYCLFCIPCFLLLTIDYLLPTTYSLLLTIYYFHLATYHLPLRAYFLLLVTYYFLLSPYYSLHAANCLVPPASRTRYAECRWPWCFMIICWFNVFIECELLLVFALLDEWSTLSLYFFCWLHLNIVFPMLFKTKDVWF